MKLCAFDFFQTESLYEAVLGLVPGESFSEIFEEADIQGTNYIVGIGPIFLYALFFPIFILVHQLSRRFIGDKVKRLSNFNK